MMLYKAVNGTCLFSITSVEGKRMLSYIFHLVSQCLILWILHKLEQVAL